MTITREQVRDLQPGDVVELRVDEYPDVTVQGPLHRNDQGELQLGSHFVLAWADGHVLDAYKRSLKVVWRSAGRVVQ